VPWLPAPGLAGRLCFGGVGGRALPEGEAFGVGGGALFAGRGG